MTEAEKAYQYFVIAVPENEEQAKAYFWARKALQSTLTQPNEPLTLEQLWEMDGEPVWVEDVKHWALIDIEKGGQWDGVPFAVWAENGANFTYNIEDRELHCFRRPPEEGAKNKNIPTSEPLTLEELRLMAEPTPVWWDWVQGWVLARKGMIISWNGGYYNSEKLSGDFYRCPPNEHLTCDGCISLGTSYGPCMNCIRSRLRGDMYRRPPVGEEEEKHVIEITENL